MDTYLCASLSFLWHENALLARQVGYVSYSGKVAGQFSGKVVVRTTEAKSPLNKLEIAYSISVIHGSLNYDPANLVFQTSSSSTLLPSRPLPFSLTEFGSFHRQGLKPRQASVRDQ